MIFNDFENIPEKLKVLRHTRLLYYIPERDIVSDLRESAYARLLTEGEIKQLWSCYTRAYYALVQMTCVDCREHRMIQLEIEFGKFMEELVEKYK
jgi:hypothetical protein